MVKAILDTNVLLASLLSRRGASFQILERLRLGEWRMVISNHLLFEYEEVLKRNAGKLGLKFEEVDVFLNALCKAADCVEIDPPQPPRLTDPDDEPLVRLAEASGTRLITTHNVRHLIPATGHGITVLLPREFLAILSSNR